MAIQYPGAMYHVMNRGDQREAIFRDDEDRQRFLTAEAGYDVDRFSAQLRAWSEAHPHAGPVVRNAEELRPLAAGESALALKDKPPPKG